MEIIADIRPWNKEMVTASLESGISRMIVPEKMTETAHRLGKITTISEDGDQVLGKDVIETTIKDKDDEDRIVKLSEKADVIVKTEDWKIIPLENLISKCKKIYTTADVSEIRTMMGILEKGVTGVVIRPKNISEIKKAKKILGEKSIQVNLIEAKVTKIHSVGNGKRSCIDTCSMMGLGQGMLVGNSSNFMFLIHSESVESEYCATRPFRVNAGAIHSYVMMSANKTKYLSEVSPGDEVLVVKEDGNSETAVVGRNKIEERPLILVEAEAGGKRSSVLLQNAETIRLVSPGSKTVSVSELKKGDTVLVKVDDTGRHFGQAIDETIIE